MDLDANSLLFSMVLGCIGLACFVYGKKQGRIPHMLVGAALVIYPYFVSNLLVMSAIAVSLFVLLWAASRLAP